MPPGTAATSTPPPAPSAPGRTDKDDVDAKLPWAVRMLLKVIDHMTSTFLGGPRCIKFSHVVNFQKGSTLLLCLGLMRKTGNYSATATVYTALHGGYGLSWLLKEAIFPDPKWDTYMTVGSAASAFAAVLGPYWVIAYNAIGLPAERSNLALCGAAVVYTLGLVLMVGADCQKYFVLKRAKGLITDGFFARTRNPNYLGEMMIYGSFAYVSCAASSWAILGTVWTTVLVPYMLRKEASMSRYGSWAAYKARTGFLLPRFFLHRDCKSE